MFYKKSIVRKFRKNHKKMPVPGSLSFIKFQACSDTGIFL